jgi:dTDP-4-dehydrorhamnose reductase
VSWRGPVAVTGGAGKLGRAILGALVRRQRPVVSWARPVYDLDDPKAAARLVARDRPSLVIHCAAWTDPDACARNPDLAMRRNASSVAELAAACARSGADFLLISTNEVFDGRRTDGLGYAEGDPTSPINPYGVSKLEGEMNAMAAFDAMGAKHALTIVRTAWLYGRPGGDFPSKILAAAEKLGLNEPLRVVYDEVGSPTFTTDVAAGILDLVEKRQGVIYHLTNEGKASRLDAAQVVLGQCHLAIRVEPISRTAFIRASSPPAWAVLDCGRADRLGVRLGGWEEPLKAYARELCTEPAPVLALD